MASKPPGPFPPPGTRRAKLVNLIPKAKRTSEEKASYWPRLTAGYPFYDDYQARSDREIPVIVLSNARKP